eukprot:m.248061 g.248061  ORF g.248061 m.248061 type:complete len:365 (-) comp15612_c0_seq1:209-1303(-)
MEQCFKTMRDSKDHTGRRRCAIFSELPERAVYPDYYEVITRPIAMSRIREKLRKHRYTTLQQFHSDFELMFRNACTYNADGSEVFQDAVAMRAELNAAIRAAVPGFEPRLEEEEALVIDTAERPKKKARVEGGDNKPVRRMNLTPKAFHCAECGSGFSRPNNLKRHIMQIHGGQGGGIKATTADDKKRIVKESPYPQSAQHILETYSGGQPMHYRDITAKAMELGMIKPQGRTPENTMHGQLNKSDLFVADGRGFFSLAKWRPRTEGDAAALPPAPAAPAAAPGEGAAPHADGDDGGGDGSSDGESSEDEAAARHRELMQSIPLTSLHKTAHTGIGFAMQGRQPSGMATLRKIIGVREETVASA